MQTQDSRFKSAICYYVTVSTSFSIYLRLVQDSHDVMRYTTIVLDRTVRQVNKSLIISFILK